MRLLLVSHYYATHRGGVEIVAREIAERLVREGGVEIEWMASDCDPCPQGLPAGLRCTPACSWNLLERIFGIAFPIWRPAAIRELRRAVRECDALHLHESIYMASVLAYLFAKRLRKPVVVTQHVGAIPYRAPARALLWLLNRTLGRLVLCGADKVFFVSPAVQRYFEGFCRLRSAAWVPNGVDTRVFAFADGEQAARLRSSAGRDPARPLLLFVGRFVPRKGIALVLELARRLPGADWIVAGDGPLRPEDGAPPNVSVVRGRSGEGIAALYRMADLLVLPSTGEGFPLVVQEAMACGTPALVSPETAQGAPGLESVLLTEPLAPERWTSRVDGLTRDIAGLRGLRAGVAQAAREGWSWDRAAQAYATALRELAASERSSAWAAR